MGTLSCAFFSQLERGLAVSHSQAVFPLSPAEIIHPITVVDRKTTAAMRRAEVGYLGILHSAFSHRKGP
ncbi:hypothetical protein CCUS01_15633 [Colletotrichum cuscutae]|uniref:Uncharacterized protein n=1 Tax=Colletotrichum cuscutae TaxID=1209917 RepID=A0AAI9VD44_9PEZI|nr:hypothetical protein CCUS01_15633 [Colletotrichum cuscutae]